MLCHPKFCWLHISMGFCLSGTIPILCTIGFALIAAQRFSFGLWIWSTAPTFGPSDCHSLNGSMKIVILGKSVNPLGWLRIFVIVLCKCSKRRCVACFSLTYFMLDSVWGVMFLLAALTSLFYAITTFFNRHGIPNKLRYRINKHLPSTLRTLIFVTIFNLGALALSIWSIESLLLTNTNSTVRQSESLWTFGQISATILLVGPLFTFVRLLRMRFFPSRTGNGGVVSLDREGMPIEDLGAHTRAGRDEEKQTRYVQPSSNPVSASDNYLH
jgi:hypothetical protein